MRDIYIVDTVWTLALAQVIAASKKDIKNTLLIHANKGSKLFGQLTNASFFMKNLWHDVICVEQDKYLSSLKLSSKTVFNYSSVLKSVFSQMEKDFDYLNQDKINNIYRFNQMEYFPRLLMSNVLKANKKIFVEQGIASYLNIRFPFFIMPPHVKFIRKNMVEWLGFGNLLSLRGSFNDFDETYFLLPDKTEVENFEQTLIMPLSTVINSENFKIYDKLLERFDYLAQKQETILYLPSTMAKDEAIPADVEKRFNNTVIEYLKNLGLRLVIKPHPSDLDEQIDFYNTLENENENILIIKDTTFPLELLSAKIKPKAVFSLYSSCLLYLKHLYGSRSFSLFPYFMKTVPEAKKLKGLEKALKEKFSNYIEFVDSLEDIRI